MSCSGLWRKSCPGVGGAPTPCAANKTCYGFEISCAGATPCGQCPTGQSCLPSGKCGCANLVCGPPNGPTGSIPSTGPVPSIPGCTSACGCCICPAGTTYDGIGTCVQNCPSRCTAWNGVSCGPVDCGPNASCNPDPNLLIGERMSMLEGRFSEPKREWLYVLWTMPDI